MSEIKDLAIGDLVLKAKKTKPKPLLTARLFLKQHQDNLLYVKDLNQYLLQKEKYFSVVGDVYLEEGIVDMVEDLFPDVFYTFQPSDWINAIKSLRPLCKKKVEESELEHDYISFNDCLYNTHTHETTPHTPDIYCYKYIDVNFSDFNKPSPAFDKYLETTFVNEEGIYNPQLVNLYQEMWGALLSGKTELNRAFILFGEGANGKSVTTELMASIILPEFLASASLESLARTFGKSQLVGKIANICSEEESQHLKNDIFKVLITGELTNFERKFEGHGTFRNRAKFIFSSNNLPKFKGMDGAIRRRIVIIPFNKVFAEEERDYNLLGKLKKETPQIIRFALEGLKRLQKGNNKFSQAEQSTELLDGMEASSNNVLAFFNEMVECDRSYTPQPSAKLFPQYMTWCKDNGNKPTSKLSFCQRFAKIRMVRKFKRPGRDSVEYYVRVLDKAPTPFAHPTF